MQSNPKQDKSKIFGLDENTPSEKLRKLAKSKDESIRMLVAQHPNTPPDVLLGLFSEFPNLVLEHPVLDLILLENPNFLIQLCEEYRDVFYDDNELPLFFLEWAANHPDIEIRQALAYNKFLPEFLIKKLALDQVEVREVLAQNDFLPEDIIEKLAEDENENVRIVIAERNEISRHIVELLATDKEVEVRGNIASNDSTPLDILEKLAEDENFNVRADLALNYNLPLSILEKLALDNNNYVKYNLVQYSVIPIPGFILENLSKSEDCSIRKAVTKHKNAPYYVLLNLVAEFPIHVLKHELIEREYKNNSNILYELFEANNNIFNEYNLPQFIFSWAINHPDPNIKIALLKSKNSIPTLNLTELSLDESCVIRSLVAGKKNTPIQALFKLSQDEDSEVRLNVAKNQNATAEILAKLFSDPVEKIRESVAIHSNISLPILKQIAFFEEVEQVRFAVIKNQNISKEILQILENDRYLQIRRAASYYLQKRFGFK